MYKVVIEPKSEGIRAWYVRTTKKSVRAFVIATACTVTLMALMWTFAPLSTLKRIQEFNGALTLPMFGGLWLYMFIFMFLGPSREGSFRAQESLDNGIGTLHEVIVQKVVPVIEIWQRIGLQVEKEYPEVIKRIYQALDDLKATSTKVESTMSENVSVAKDARPVIVALKRIADAFEKADVIESIQDLSEAVQRLAPLPGTTKTPEAKVPETRVAVELPGAPVVAVKSTEPDLASALSRIGKKKAEVPQSKV